MARSRSIPWAARVLLDHGMPATKVHSILVTDDPEIIRRQMELHRERLEERLMDQRLVVGHIKVLLTEVAHQREIVALGFGGSGPQRRRARPWTRGGVGARVER